MAAAQDTPGTPGRQDTGLGLGGEASFAGALTTGTDAPEDPWARVAEQLAWEERRGAALAPNPSAPLLAEPSTTAPRPAALPFPAAGGPAADLPTKPSLPAAPAQYGQWRAQALARGLRSVFVAAADDFTSAPPPSPGLELLATPPEIQVGSVAVPVPSPAPADRPLVAPAPPVLPAVTSGTQSRPDPAPATPAVTPGLPPLPAGRRPGGLLGAVQRPVSSRPPEDPPAQEPAPAAASPPPQSEARLRALAARADQTIRQRVQHGKTLLQRLLHADQKAAPPPPASPTEPDSG